MYNKVVLVGYLTRDVEVRYSQTGSAISSVGIATNRRWKSQTGEMRDETMFIDLTFFGRTAEVAHQYLRKGSKVLVDGRLKLEQWVAQDGTKRSKHSVTVESLTMLDTKAESQALAQNRQVQQNSYGMGQQPPQPQQGYNQPPVQQQPYSQPQQNYGQPQQQQSSPPPNSTPQPQQTNQPSVPVIDIDEDEIPF
jgi:single-strand DNA-binding protein